MFSSATLSELTGARVYLKAELFQKHRLVQAARRAHQARRALGRGAGARRDLDLGRQPRAGARLRARARGHRLPRRHVAGRERARRSTATRALRRRGRPRGRTARPRRSSGSPSCSRGDRPHARPPVRRPADDRRPGDGRARDRRGRPGRRRRRRPGRRRRARSPAIAVARAGPAASSASSPSSRAAHARGARGRRAGPGRRRARSPTASTRRSPASTASRSAASSSTRSCSSPRTRSRRECASSTRARSSPASRPERPRRPRCWPERSPLEPGETVVAVVSGGNVAPETASAILARTMKADIHPEYVLATVRCSCGNEFQTRSTKPELHVEICSACHPFYTGKQKLVDTGGRVERFQRRLEKAGRSARATSPSRERAHRRPGRPRGRDDARPVELGGRRPQAGRRDRRGLPPDRRPSMARHWVFRLPVVRGVDRARRVARDRLPRARDLGELRGAGRGRGGEDETELSRGAAHLRVRDRDRLRALALQGHARR